MSLVERTKNFAYLSSVDRESGTNSAFRVSLTRPISNLKTVTLESCTIPYTFWNVRTTSYVPLKEAGFPLANVYVPAAMYTPTSLATALSTAMTAASPSGATYTVVYDQATGKFTISNATLGFELQFLSDFNSSNVNHFAFYLGWNNPIVDTGFALSHTSNGIARLTEQYLVLKIFPIGTGYESSANLVGGSTFAMIPLTGNAFDQILYVNKSFYDQSTTLSVTGQDYKTFFIQLTHVDGTEVDLNGNPLSLVLSYTQHGNVR